MSRRYTREDPVEPSGRVKAYSCRAATFLIRNTVLYISELCQHNFDDTSRGQINQNSVRRRKKLKNGHGKDQGLESIGSGHGNWEELGWQEQDNLLGLSVRG